MRERINSFLINDKFNDLYPEVPESSLCDCLSTTVNFLENCRVCFASLKNIWATIDELANGDQRVIEREQQMEEIKTQAYIKKRAADAELHRLKTIADTEKEERILLAETEKYVRTRKADANLYEDRRKADYGYYKRKKKLDKKYGTQYNPAYNINNIDAQPTNTTVQEGANGSEDFYSEFGIPELPPFIKEILIKCPDAFRVPMLLHILTMLGSCSFSRVRAEYLDKRLHAPNLQIVIEGVSGQGKGHFETVYKEIFGRIIERDMKKLGDNTRPIVQTIGSEITPTQLHNTLANNLGVHTYMFEAEILSLCGKQKSSSGITPDLLRKAFDNSAYYKNSSRTENKGAYPVFLNFTATGTPRDCKRFIEGIECDGNATRIAWASIPNCGKELPTVILPKGDKLEAIRDKIDEWTQKYSYCSNDRGDNCVAQEHSVDLSYINLELNRWLEKQYDQSIEEGNPARNSIRTRIATMAFHFAIPIHMLYNECSNGRAYKQKTIDLVIYIANYCMERCLYKFSDVLNEECGEAVCKKVASHIPLTSHSPSRLSPSDEELAEWSRLQKLPNDEGGMSWKQLADTFGKKYGLGDRQAMINTVRKYRKEHPDE